MKTNTYHPQPLRCLLAALLFLLLPGLRAAGQDEITTWDKIKEVKATSLANKDNGNGESSNAPILIANREELIYFAQQVNRGGAIALRNGDRIEPDGKNKGGGFFGYYFALTSDIDLSDYYWKPIGKNVHPFNGHFDGRGHCVKGLMVKVEKTFSGEPANGVYAGLFGNAIGASLRNLGVILADKGVKATATNGHAYAGGIAGQANEIHNCYVVGAGEVEAVSTKDINISYVEPDSYSGGIVGYLPSSSSLTNSSLTNCYATVSVKADGYTRAYAGGIAGLCWGTLSYTYATGSVEATGKGEGRIYAGGICGYVQGRSSTLSLNLALNRKVKGGGGESNRIVGKQEDKAMLTDNYASPEMQVNGKVVDNGDENIVNGDASVSLNNFVSIFDWGDGWDTSDATRLPQLNIQTGDNPDSYTAWPTGNGFTPQRLLDASCYLTAQIANTNGGTGLSSDAPILIASAEELAYFAQQVNSYEDIKLGNDGSDSGKSGSINHNDEEGNGFSKYYFALTNDIDLSPHYWTPIGNWKHPFNGNFDGRGHCVSGLKVKVEGNSGGVNRDGVYAGLFGYALKASLCNLGVVLADEGVQGISTDVGVFAGGIAGQAKDIRNCYVVGTGEVRVVVTTIGNLMISSSIGGIVGSVSSSLTHCYATVSVKAEVNGSGGCDVRAGGIAGGCDGSLSYTYATGAVEVTGRGSHNAGGICGYVAGGKNTLSHNLALNEYVKGGEGKSNRIVGDKGMNVQLASNYASPEIWVNGTFVSNGAGTDKNGDSSVNLGNFWSVFDWGKGWDISDATRLPQLNIQTVDDPNSYTDWPTGQGYTPQPSLSAADYLMADKLVNAGDGTGLSWADAILIANRAELAYFAQQVNSGEAITLGKGGSSSSGSISPDEGGKNFSAYFFALSANIDLSDYYWTPIGNNDNYFNGNFDGRGHCVEGLKVEVKEKNEDEDGGYKSAYAGLFGYANGASLRNLGVILAEEGVQATATNSSAYAGGIAGQAEDIRNCYVVGTGKVEAVSTTNSVSVTPGSYSGGIVGYLFPFTSSLTHCYATVNVKADGNGLVYAGGIAGECQGSLSCTYAIGSVEAPGGGWSYAGGICGRMWSSRTLSHNLALNKEVKGGERESHRIAGDIYDANNITSNYASTKTEVKHNNVSNVTITPDVNGLDGADTWIETFKEDLMSSPVDPAGDWSKGWVFDSDNKYLPQLEVDGSGGGNSKQPSILSSSVLVSKPVPPPPTPEPEPEPVPVYYTVTLPSVEGAVTDPVAGDYDVEAWSTFRFYLTLDTAYSLSQPVVTTSRGETLSPRTSDGAYLLKYVRTDVEVFIDGVVKNPDPVSNEPIRAGSQPEIWSEKSCLCLRPADSDPTALVRILTADGRLLETFRSVPGLNRRQLPTGIYIVLVGDTVRKVAIR